MLGYDSQQVQNMVTAIGEGYNAVIGSVQSALQTNVIDPVAPAWAAQDAVNFFQNLESLCETMTAGIRREFENYRSRIQSALDAWERTTGSEEHVTLDELPDSAITLDASNILPNRDGKVYIDPTLAEAALASIRNVRNVIEAQVNGTTIDLSQAQGFLGDEQMSTLQNCIAGIGTQIAPVFNILTNNNGQSLTSKIEDALARYRAQVSTTQSGFGGLNSSVTNAENAENATADAMTAEAETTDAPTSDTLAANAPIEESTYTDTSATDETASVPEE